MAIGAPGLGDGPAMWELARVAGLDENSQYQYLLFCRDFTETSVVARSSGVLVGFVIGYRRPGEPGTLFVWQVGVAPSRHGRGIGRRMLDHLFAAQLVQGVTHLEATVAPDNAASIALFSGLARRHGMWARWSPLFGTELFSGGHQAEVLVRMGPNPQQGAT